MNLSSCLRRVDNSLQTHPSMSLVANPVLKTLASKTSAGTKLMTQVLEQYCFLPADIINLLQTARDRLSAWPNVEEELARNIGEEKGSRTAGVSHYKILERALLQELELDVTRTKMVPATINFLTALKSGLATSKDNYVAGMIYGLENSAILELIVAAQLINCFALSTGQHSPLITIPPKGKFSKDHETSYETSYSLDTFFRMHLLDFEVGHKNGLALAFHKQNAQLMIDLLEFEAGFEFTLTVMDTWWEELAAL